VLGERGVKLAEDGFNTYVRILRYGAKKGSKER
jgi:hypothetical protein